MMKIILADDHKMIRDGVKTYLENDNRFEVIGEASSGEEVLDLLKTIDGQVDVILMDINMNGMDGLECTQQVLKKYPTINILALTMLSEALHIKKMVSAGAKGYILKNSSENDIKNALMLVNSGKQFYSQEVTMTIMESMTNKKKSSSGYAPDTPLTSRETEVLKLIVKEFTNQEIADELYISVRTVDAHKRNLLEKTGAKNVAGLVLFAINNKFAEAPAT